MVKVEFLGPLNRDDIDVEINFLSELKEIFKDDKELQEWLEVCAVAVNDSLVCSLNTKVEAGDKISLLPPVCGG